MVNYLIVGKHNAQQSEKWRLILLLKSIEAENIFCHSGRSHGDSISWACWLVVRPPLLVDAQTNVSPVLVFAGPSSQTVVVAPTRHYPAIVEASYRIT